MVLLFADTLQHSRQVQTPTTLAQTSNVTIETAPTRQINLSKTQCDGDNTMWMDPLWHLVCFAQHHHCSHNSSDPSFACLASFPTTTNNKFFKIMNAPTMVQHAPDPPSSGLKIGVGRCVHLQQWCL